MTPRPGWDNRTLILGRNDITALLGMADCIDAVERAFLDYAAGTVIPPAVLGTHTDGGSFHVKTAGMSDAVDGRAYFAAKVNANFPGNPDRNGLPTIQGVLVLFDAADGRVLALLDSLEITTLRTAAATAVAAKYLAPDVARVTICGCGEQARSQLRALACVRPLERVAAIDTNGERARRLADEMSVELGVEVVVAREPGESARATNVWITCTPAARWFLGREHVAPGSFVAAVGADNPHKQEIEPELLAMNVVVADILDQCATIGDLHHALDAGMMQRGDVRAELADVVAGRKVGRQSVDEIIVFDSTGTALQDVAAAMVAYHRGLAMGVGSTVDLGMLGPGEFPHA